MEASETLEFDLLANPEDTAVSTARLYIWGQPTSDGAANFRQLHNLTLDVVSMEPMIDFLDDQAFLDDPMSRYSLVRDSQLSDELNPAFQIQTTEPAEIVAGDADAIRGLQGLNFTSATEAPGIGVGPECHAESEMCVETPNGPVWRIGSFGIQTVGITGSVPIHLQIGNGGISHLASDGGSVDPSSLTDVIFSASNLSSPIYNAAAGEAGDRQKKLEGDAPEVLIHISDQLTGDYNADGNVNGADFLAWQRAVGTSDLPGRRNVLGGPVGQEDLEVWQQNVNPSFAPIALPPNGADFNSDGSVDGTDFLTWQRNFGIFGLGEGDADFDGNVDGDDLAIWREQYGSVLGLSAATHGIPEPTTLVLAALGVIGASLLRRRQSPAVATLLILVFLSWTAANIAQAQAINASWLSPTDGNWSDAANWDTTDFPNNGVDTYDVTIDETGSPYVVTLDTDVTIDSLVLDSADARLRLDTQEVLTITDTLTLTDGTLEFFGARIVGGTINQAPGSQLRFDTPNIVFTNNIDGTVLNADLTVGASTPVGVRFENGGRFTGDADLAVGSSSPGTSVAIQDTQVLDNRTINVGRAAFGVLGNHQLTFGVNTQVNLLDDQSTLDSDVQVVGDSGVGTITNLGTITANGTGNAGTIRPDIFDNQSLVDVVAGILTLRGNADWTNTGVYRVQNGATLRISGSNSTTESLGQVDNTAGGTVQIDGTLQNAGQTLALDATTGDFTLFGGTVVGGTISQSGGARLKIEGGTQLINTLNGTTLQGDLDIASGTRVSLTNGATFTGNANVSGFATSLAIDDDLTLNNQTINVSNNGGFGEQGGGQDSTITLGLNAEVNLDDGFIGNTQILNFPGANSLLINQGTITSSGTSAINYSNFDNQGTVNVVSGRLDISSPIVGNSWTNTGVYRVQNGATLRIRGSNLTTDALGQVDNTAGGAVQIDGTLQNAGQTLALDNTTGNFTLVGGGTIVGGNITVSGGAELIFDGGTVGSTLDGVTLEGNLNLSSGNRLILSNGSTFTGNATIDGGFTQLAIDGDLTLDNRTINVLNNSSFGERGGGLDSTITLGANTQVNLDRGTLSNTLIFNSAGVDSLLINQGIITSNGSSTINYSNFNNQGTVEVASGTLSLSTPVNDNTWMNTGVYRVQQAGTLRITTGNFTTTRLGHIDNTAGGIVSIEGALDNTGQTLALDETTGDFTLGRFGRIVGGTITRSGGAELIFGGGTQGTILDGTTLEGDLNLDGALTLANGATFTGNANISGNLGISGDLTFDDKVINLDRGGLGRRGGAPVSTVTFGPNTQVSLANSSVINTSQINNDAGPGSRVVNQGVISATTASRIEPNLFDNQGLVEVTAGTVTINGNSNWTNSGTYRVASGARMQLRGGIPHTGTAQLTGSGIVDVDNFINEAIVRPGNSPGILTIDGDYTQTSDGLLEIEIGGLTAGTEHDRLDVNGAATLAGRLEVPLIDGFVPTVGDEVTFLQADSVSGAFENVVFPDPLPVDVAQQLDYSSTDVRVQFVAPIPIDFVSADAVAEWTTPTDWEENGMDATPDSVNILSVSNNLGTGQTQTVNVVDPLTPTEINAAHSLVVGDTTDEIVLRINDTSLSSSTTTTIGANGVIEQIDNSVLSGRMLKIQGGGRFAGEGTVIGDIEVGMTGSGDAMVEPGIAGVGQFIVDGNYTQGAGGVFAVDIMGNNSGENHDSIDVSGTVALEGTLKIDAASLTQQEVTPGDVFEIITAEEGLSGEFSEVLIEGGDGLYFEVIYSDSGLPIAGDQIAALTTISSPAVFLSARMMGDANGDMIIDEQDSRAFAAAILDFTLGYNFEGGTRASLITQRNAFNFSASELNDTIIDVDDIPGFVELFSSANNMTLASGYQALNDAFAQVLAARAVPEPTALGLCGLCLLIVGNLRFRKARSC